ncbi:helix-turn-helix domain-containing protein [Desulfovibrio sp. OttesenSCG-928-C06]|nr:helix-turn-helix domain-containing protein [Desulfovibrio sp. OttesenSCG-928-C06]
MQPPDTRAWYAAFKAKDARFDGRFFVGVSSTGIYCRPVCPARLPKEQNCTFYETAAAAEQAGFRPCLMCRPELAPGSAPIDATSALVRSAARLLEENCGTGQSIDEYAKRLGCSARHLRRAFTAEFKVSPVQYLQTCRLLLAKNLLTDTGLSVLDVAMASGFGSLRRFNDLFRKQYRLSPTGLRRQAASSKNGDGHVTLLLGYRPPYQWGQILDFLAARAIPGVESVDGDGYARTVHCAADDQKLFRGWLRVAHQSARNALAVTASSTLLPVLPYLLARVRNLFDLYCYPDAVYESLAAMNSIKPGLCVAGTRLPGCFEPFELAVRAILGQQITVKAARTIAGRLVAAFGAPLETGIKGLTHTFPTPCAITALEDDITGSLGPLGITGARARTILHLARNFAAGELDFSLCAQPEKEIEKLMAIPGIGVWTAQYMAMRAMSWPDAFPHTDHGVKKALEPLPPEDIPALAEKWRPWRSYATINLWNSLNT